MFILFLIMKVLLYLLITILCFILLFVIIPFDYEFNTKIDEKIKAGASLSFFHRILKIMMTYEGKETMLSIKLMGLKVIRKKIKVSTKEVKKDEIKNKKNNNFNIKDYFQREFINDLISYFKDIINIIKPKGIKTNGIYGFEDPSLTGIACGIIPIVSSLIPTSHINLEPVFHDEIIDIYCEIYGRVSLLLAAIRTLRFVLKKNNRRKIFKKLKKSETY